MTASAVLVAALLASGGHDRDAGTLPVCNNRVINQVVKRAGCTLGDARCWKRSGGFCTDYIEKRIAKARRPIALERIEPDEVRKGDVAVFASRAHYAYVEDVARDDAGRPVAVDLSEYNFGTCWVDEEVMVTEQYKIVNRRSGVALQAVDGGFMRAIPRAR